MLFRRFCWSVAEFSFASQQGLPRSEPMPTWQTALHAAASRYLPIPLFMLPTPINAELQDRILDWPYSQQGAFILEP